MKKRLQEPNAWPLQSFAFMSHCNIFLFNWDDVIMLEETIVDSVHLFENMFQNIYNYTITRKL